MPEWEEEEGSLNPGTVTSSVRGLGKWVRDAEDEKIRRWILCKNSCPCWSYTSMEASV